MIGTLKIKWRDPRGLAGIDAAGVCRCEDGADYVLKDGAADPLTPHNEWFSTHLAQAVKIVCPPCAIIEDEHGNLLFGSRWEGGVSSSSWLSMVHRGELNKTDIAAPLSRILAFDYFIQNGDRHLDNYIVRGQRNGHLIMAIDFSRSWCFEGFHQHLFLSARPRIHVIGIARSNKKSGISWISMK